MRNLKVLVTRPKEQGIRLSERLTEEGFTPILAPMIEIAPLDEPLLKQQAELLSEVQSYAAVVAISANAVRAALEIWTSLNISPDKDLHWYAVGQATADVMLANGIAPETPETRFDTDGLLALESMRHINGQSILLLAGQGGRRKLEAFLRDRGASVERAELYRRIPVAPEEIVLAEEPDAMIAMSGETIDAMQTNLSALGKADWLTKPTLVPSARIAEIAFECGFQNVRLTEKATENSLVQTLCRLASEV